MSQPTVQRRSTTRRRHMTEAYYNSISQFPTEIKLYILSFAFPDSTLIRFKFPDPNFQISNIIRSVRISTKANIAGLKRYPFLETVIITSDRFNDDDVLKERVDPAMIVDLTHDEMDNFMDLTDDPATYPDTVKNFKIEDIHLANINTIPRNMESLSITSNTRNAFSTSIISNLKSLNLNGVDLVGNLDFGSIEELELTKIHLSGSNQTKPVFSPNIKRLFLDHFYLIRSIFSNYQLLENLKYLHLETKDMKVLDLSKLDATGLETLIINDIESLKIDLSGFKRLKKLQITKCKKTEQVKGISSLTQLEHLVLRNSNFDSTYFDIISSFLQLKFVDISYTNVTNFDSIKSIFKLPNLTVFLCISERSNNDHKTKSNMLHMRKVLENHKNLKLFSFNVSWIKKKLKGKYYLELPIESEERAQIIDLLFNTPTNPRRDETFQVLPKSFWDNFYYKDNDHYYTKKIIEKYQAQYK